MIPIYTAVGFACLVMILVSKSHKLINFLSALHPLAYLALAAYSLSYSDTPRYFVSGGYFFIDRLGLYEVMLTSSLFFLAAIYSRGYVEGLMNIGELDRTNLKLFYAAFNLLLMAVTYAFFSNNLALFWIFAELTTLFSATLIVTLNAKKNIGAALKYLFITSTSMLFAFIGLIFIFAATESALGSGTLNWSELMKYAGSISPTILFASFVLLFVGFAAKAGAVPFHAWLPSAYSKAPSAISAILSGSVSGVGIYGILRVYAIISQTSAAQKASALLVAFGLFSIAAAAFSMLTQINLKKLIAFSSIENTGIMLVGIGLGTPLAVFWVLFHLAAHALTKALLFFSAGIMHRQYGSMHADRITNALKVQPLASAGLIIGSVAIIGMPPFAIFISKLSILIQAAGKSGSLLVAILVLLLCASAAFALYLVRVFSETQNSKAPLENYSVPFGMKAAIAALIVIITVFGIYFPQYLKDLLFGIVAELGIR